jgi:hypothetical protein
MIILQIYNHHENQLLYSLQDQDILKENLPVTQIRFPAFPLSGAIEENRLLCIQKRSFIMQAAWHSPNMLPTMVHGQVFHIITWQPPSRGSPLFTTPRWAEQLVCVFRSFRLRVSFVRFQFVFSSFAFRSCNWFVCFVYRSFRVSCIVHFVFRVFVRFV